MSPARQFFRWLLRQEVISLNNIIYDSPRLVIETKDILLPNGKERKYLFVQPVEAVCILPVDEEYVYLIRQYRAVIDSYILEVVAGGMDKEGESKEDAARRELAEEARMQAEEIIPRGFVYSSPGFCTEKLWLFEARGLSPCEDLAMDEDEIIEQVKVKRSEVFSMIASGEISDAKTIALLTRVLNQ
ncbi:MAG: NUDIX hydrolase [Methanocorpusculum sp.]|nr:NUDIX hydrolase [Methanocorpusculum sp.]